MYAAFEAAGGKEAGSVANHLPERTSAELNGRSCRIRMYFKSFSQSLLQTCHSSLLFWVLLDQSRVSHTRPPTWNQSIADLL